MRLQERGIIERLAVFPFQHAALLQNLVGTVKHGHVVQPNNVGARVREKDGAGFGMNQRFQGAVEIVRLMDDDMVCRFAFQEVDEVLEHFVWHVEFLGHDVEHRMDVPLADSAKFHESQQQPLLFSDGNFSYEEELGTNADIKHIV